MKETGLLEKVCEILRLSETGLMAKDLVRELKALGITIDKSELNSVLYANRASGLSRDDEYRWTLKASTRPAAPAKRTQRVSSATESKATPKPPPPRRMEPVMPGNGASFRKLPTCHLSIRVPWHDSGWAGCTCTAPEQNLSCAVLRRIAEKRDPKKEKPGSPWHELTEEQLPLCAAEHGAFMSPQGYVKHHEHPYKDWMPELYSHFKKTRFEYPSFSAACVPFEWMLKSNMEGTETEPGLAERYRLKYFPEREPEALHDKTDWIQEKDNQLVALDTFFSAVHEQVSLCFFYAKRTPLSEDHRRVIVGAGLVTSVGKHVEYEYEREGPLRCVLWERNVGHSIRPGFQEGFLLPYQEIQKLSEEDPLFDPEPLIAFAPDDHFKEFSYGSNHVSDDGAIASLLSCARALERIEAVEKLKGPWSRARKWIDTQLNRMWAMRGPFPGIGSALTAFGFQRGTLIAWELANLLPKYEKEVGGNAWKLFDKAVANPAILGPAAEDLDASLSKRFKSLDKDRRALLELLSRFSLTEEQATRWYQETERENAEIGAKDEEILANPYIIYERDRYLPDAVGLGAIDRGVFPDASIQERFPIPGKAAPEGAVDDRRVRAFAVQALEVAAAAGHTVQPRGWVIDAIRGSEVKPPRPVSKDVLSKDLEDSFKGEILVFEMSDKQKAYQLQRLADAGKVISGEIKKRQGGRPHAGTHLWRRLVDKQINVPVEKGTDEERAREEKASALEQLYRSRIAVLIGPAGTGKTTLLKALCAIDEVKHGGILLLAPTGKARVRMQQQTGETGAKTIAQFLLRLGRYDAYTGRYHTSADARSNAHKTVIIDECSMLTEEQLAAVIDGVSGVERLILVGDPRQLPPIGSGRPFVDIVRFLAPKNVESRFPRSGPCYGELIVPRRQQSGEKGGNSREARDDLLLARWFGGGSSDPGADEIWDKLATLSSPRLRLIRWETPEELQPKLMAALVDELKLAGGNEENCFETSLGGHLFEKNNAVYFHHKGEGLEGAASKAEAWQVLSPVRAGLHGVEALNLAIQGRFRKRAFEWSQVKYNRRVPQPLGPQRILYGDKVINVRNQLRDRVWPKPDERAIPLANGDIGIVVGEYKGQNSKMDRAPKHLEIEFVAWQGHKVTFWKSEFGEESTPTIELAYALTVHKTQGSEFKLTFVVLPNPCRLLSRELLYTALTRQQDRVVVLHQGELRNLRLYADDKHSDIAKRLTNLFDSPHPVEHDGTFLEDGLIHRTGRGELVRSKSEVIVADKLATHGIPYLYEQEFVGADGSRRYPDFTIEDAATGMCILWEHLGMLHDEVYRRRWEAKLAWYRENGVLPHSEGGGARGTLVTSEDSPLGGIDSKYLERLMKLVFKL